MGVQYTQIGIADTAASDLVPATGVKGYMAFARDTNQFYAHNGTLWVPQSTMAGPQNLIIGPDGTVASNQPTLSVNTAVAGGGATASIVGNNISGTIVLTTGTSITNGGAVLTLTLANGASFSKNMQVVFSGGDTNFANILTKLFVTQTKNVATLNVAGLALGASTVYTGNYIIAGW